MKRIILHFLYLSFTIILSCGNEYRISNRRGYRNYNKGNPYNALRYIRNFQIRYKDYGHSDTLLVILKKYSPDAYYMINRFENMPDIIKIGGVIVNYPMLLSRQINFMENRESGIRKGSKFRRWIKSRSSFFNQILKLPTAVHEISHDYTNRYSNYLFSKTTDNSSILMYRPSRKRNTLVSFSFDSFYRQKNKTLFVLKRNKNNITVYDFPIFAVREIASYIPVNKRTLRFKTYILSAHSGQVHGLLGLLDEYNAYYWSSKVSYDLYDYFRFKRKQTAANWIEWIRLMANDYFAYVEFRYWILNYLLYAEKNNVKTFNSLMKDIHLRRAFTHIDDDYTHLIKKIFSRFFIELPAHLKNFNIKTKIYYTNHFFRGKRRKDIRYQIGRMSTPLYANCYLTLQSELRKKRFIKIADTFRLSTAAKTPIIHLP